MTSTTNANPDRQQAIERRYAERRDRDARRITIAAYTGFACAALTLALSLMALAPGSAASRISSPSALVDAALLFGLAYGVLRRSRACAVLLLAYALVNALMRPAASALTIALLIVYALGVQATFAERRKRSDVAAA